MDLAVTICTDQHTFIELLFDHFPTPRLSARSTDGERLGNRIDMMKMERAGAVVIAADNTSSSFISYRFGLKSLPSALNHTRVAELLARPAALPPVLTPTPSTSSDFKDRHVELTCVP